MRLGRSQERKNKKDANMFVSLTVLGRTQLLPVCSGVGPEAEGEKGIRARVFIVVSTGRKG